MIDSMQDFFINVENFIIDNDKSEEIFFDPSVIIESIICRIEYVKRSLLSTTTNGRITLELLLR